MVDAIHLKAEQREEMVAVVLRVASSRLDLMQRQLTAQSKTALETLRGACPERE